MKKSLFLSTLVLAASCGGDDGGPPKVELPASDTTMCAVLGIDYLNNVGLMSVVGLPSRTVIKDVVPGAVGGDAVLRGYNGKLYVVNRSTSNITEINPTGSTGQVWTVDKQFSTGAMSDPQDIAVSGTTAYVVTYNAPQIQLWDLSQAAPTAAKSTIDLSATTIDSDGNPQAQSIYIKGNRAYVTLDLLDENMTPRGNGKIAVINTDANIVATTFDLTYANPYNFMIPFNDQLIVVSDGDFSGTTGCIERITTSGTPAATTCLVEDNSLTATIGAIAATPSEVYFVASTYDAMFHPTSTLHKVSAAGALSATPLTPAGENPSDVYYVAQTNQILYGDTKGGGLRVFDIATQAEVTTTAIDIGLTPGAVNSIVCMSR